MNRSFLFATLFLFLGTFSHGALAQVFNPTVFTLENGLTIAVIEKPGLPVVSHMVWYKAGSRDDPAGKSGIAHYLEHMMFRGTTTTKDGDFSKAVAAAGGEDNAFTSWDFTAYFQKIPATELESMMKLEADRMVNLLLDREIFDREKNVILEERASRTGNSPGAQLHEQVGAAFYQNQPYGRPIIGWEEEIKNLEMEDFKTFYQRYYAPNNAIVVVAGGVTADDVKTLAEKTYGKVPRKAVMRTPMAVEPPHIANQTVLFSHPHVRQDYVTVKWLAPSYLDGETKHAYALQVLDEILGAGETGDLYKHFVLNKKLAVGVSTSYDPMRTGMTGFSIGMVPAEGISLKTLQTELHKFLTSWAASSISIDRLDITLNRLQADAIYVQDSLQSGAHLFGQAFTIGLPFDVIETWPAKIGAITQTDLQAALDHVITDKAYMTATLEGEKK